MNQIDDPNITIVVEPPDVHYLTDEDSADEEDSNLNRFSGNQLRAPAIITNNSDSIDDACLTKFVIPHLPTPRVEVPLSLPKK